MILDLSRSRSLQAFLLILPISLFVVVGCPRPTPPPATNDNVPTNDNIPDNENDNDVLPPGATGIGSIGDREVPLGSTLELALAVSGAAIDDTTFSASPLPLPMNATLSARTGVFTFTPQADQIGSFEVTFEASAAEQTAEETITITVPAPAADAVTSLSGRILGTDTGAPLVNVRMMIGEVETFSDEEGLFVLSGIGGGVQALTIDATAVAGGTFPRLTENVTLIENAPNVMPRTIFLPELDFASGEMVDPSATSIIDSADVVIDGENLGRVVLTILANTATDATTGEPFSDIVSITIVPEDRGPLPLPEGIDPSIYLTIQPFNAVFDPPAPITFPNIDGYDPGASVDIFGLDRDTGEFEKVGTGTVSADGSKVVSDGGVISSGSWHAVVPPTIIVDEDGRVWVVFDRPWQQKQGGSSEIGVRDGSLAIRHDLPGIRRLGETIYLGFVYSSDTAHPQPVINFDVTNPLRGPVPETISTKLSVGGLDQGEIFSDGAGMVFNSIAPLRQAFQFDAEMLDTGLYSFDMVVVCTFPGSKRETAPVQGRLMVHNNSAGPLGAGWGIRGFSRLLPQADGTMLIVDGDGSATAYTPEPTGDNGLTMVMYDVTDPAGAVAGAFEGIDAGTFTVTTADGTVEVDSTVVPLVNFPDTALDTGAFFNLGANNVLDEGSTVEAPLGDDISIQPPGGNDTFGAQFTGFLFIPTGGDVEFSVGYDDAVAVIVNGESVIASTGLTDFKVLTGIAENLDAGVVAITINYAESGGEANVVLSASGGGLTGGLIPQRFFFVQPPDPDFVPTNFVGPHAENRLTRAEDGSFTLAISDGTANSYDSAGRLLTRTDTQGNAVTYTYDAQDRIETITYPPDGAYRFEYDAAGLSSVTDPAGRVTKFTMQDGDLTSIENPDGGTVRYAYAAHHRMTQLTTARGATYRYSYGGSGMIREVTLPGGEVRSFAPSQSLALPSGSGEGTQENPLAVVQIDDVHDEFTDGMGETTQYVTDRMGSVLKETDATGRVVDITRDGAGRIKRLVRFNRTAATLAYDTLGNLTSVTEEDNGAVSQFRYDADGNMTEIITPLGRTYTLGYDTKGNMTSYTDAGGTTTRAYDAQGLPVRSTDAIGNSITYGYDVNCNVTSYTDESGHKTTFTLDAAGNLAGASNDFGQSASFAYDGMGRPVGMTNELGQTTTFGYDAQGNVTSITDANGGVTTIAFDEIGLQTSMTDPLGGVTGYTYDIRQDRSTTERPDGGTITFSYDALQRRTTTDLPGGDRILFEYNDYSSFARVADNDSNLVLSHSPLGALTQMAYGDADDPAVIDPPVALSFAYDLDGNRSSFTDAEGVTTTISYDDRPLPTALSNSGVTHALTYDPRTLLTAVATSISGGAASSMQRTYSATYQLESIVNTVGETVVSSMTIVIDSVGNRTRIVDDDGAERVYAYSASGQLLRATHSDQPDESYTYDALGNRLTSHLDAGTAEYDAANRIVRNGSHSFVHDANGNLTRRTDIATTEYTEYTYDALNHLIRAETFDAEMSTSVTTYTYNGIGHRTSKNVDGTVTKYVQNPRGEIVAEFDGDDNLLATYMYGPERQMLLSMKRGGQQYVYHRDHVGSVIQITDKDGAVVNTYQYDSFGNTIAQTQGVDNPFRYAGAHYDAETGLYYMKFRYYDPQIGRFLTPDPYSIIGSGPNLYTYVKNNPVNLADPQGFFGVGAVAGFGVNLAGQGIEAVVGKKGGAEFSWGSLVFDTVLGGVTCGLGSGFQAGRLATKIPKVARWAKRASQTRGGRFIQNPAGNAAIGSFGKDAIVNQRIDANTLRDFLILGGANKLGGGLSRDFGVDELMRDGLVNGGLALTEMLKAGLIDDKGRKLLDATRGTRAGVEILWGDK